MTESHIPTGRSVPSQYEIPLAPYWATFKEILVDLGAKPALPDGSAGVTDREAVTAAATAFLGDPRPGVQVAAHYGIFSSDYPAKRLPSGQLQPLCQNRPVWLVTYFGPGFNLPTHRPDRSGHPVFKHAFSVLVDASTGAVLSAFG